MNALSQSEIAHQRIMGKMPSSQWSNWESCMKEACSWMNLSMPSCASAFGRLDLSLERMLLDLREDLSDEREALSILFSTNDFLSQMVRKFPSGGRLEFSAQLMPDGSALALVHSDKAKLGRMAAEHLEGLKEGLGMRLLPRLACVNLSMQGGLELEEAAHLESSRGLPIGQRAFSQMPAQTVSSYPKGGHPIAKWIAAVSERYSQPKRCSEEDLGKWKAGVDAYGGVAPDEFASIGAVFEVWADFRPEALVGRLGDVAGKEAQKRGRRSGV